MKMESLKTTKELAAHERWEGDYKQFQEAHNELIICNHKLQTGKDEAVANLREIIESWANEYADLEEEMKELQVLVKEKDTTIKNLKYELHEHISKCIIQNCHCCGRKSGGSGMNELITQVEQWSKDKGLHKTDSTKQALKFFEEAGEVAAALARNNEDDFKDAVGDTIVTLIILAQQNGTNVKECLEVAYNEIKGRKGKTINGVFVKEADLED